MNICRLHCSLLLLLLLNDSSLNSFLILSEVSLILVSLMKQQQSLCLSSAYCTLLPIQLLDVLLLPYCSKKKTDQYMQPPPPPPPAPLAHCSSHLTALSFFAERCCRKTQQLRIKQSESYCRLQLSF